jgi:tyrosine-specific transport protein
MERRFLTAVATIIGTIIGAGILGLPYAIAKSGFFLGLLNMLVVGLATTLMTLYMGEIVLRTRKVRQFTGLAEIYLGKFGKALMFLSVVIGIYGALVAYLTGIGSSIASLLGGGVLFYSTIFFIPAFCLIHLGLKAVGEAQLVLSSVLIATLLIICAFLFPSIRAENLSFYDPSKIFSPLGVILFAWLGYSVMPEIEEILKKEKKLMRRAVILASLICGAIYLLFTAIFIGTFGSKIEEIAIESLQGSLLWLGTCVAILSMFTSFLALGMVLRDTFRLDLKLERWQASVLACGIPFLLFRLFFPGFITALGLTGTYAGGLTGIIACLMIKRARKLGDVKPAYVVPGGDVPIAFSLLIFIFGILYQTLAIFGMV